MKVKYIPISETKDEYFNSEHLVLAYGESDNETKIYLIADRELEVIEPSDKQLSIIDNNLNDYTNVPKLNYDKNFYVHNEFLKLIKDINSYSEIKNDSLWLKSKLFQFCKQKEFTFSNNFKETVLNEKYKIGLLNGFLTYANHTINIKNKDSSYRTNFRFNILQNINYYLTEEIKSENYSFENVNQDNYKSRLIKFISESLTNNSKVKEDENLNRLLFELFDSLFIDDLESIFSISTFYDDMIIVKYNSKFYQLNFDWTS